MIGLGHAVVSSNDLPKAKAFYDALMGSAGVTPLFEHPSGGRAYGQDGSLFFVVLGPYDKRLATVGNGAHVDLPVRYPGRGRRLSRQGAGAWRRRRGALRASGAPGFYMSYFRDLDGNKLCAFNLG